MKIEYPPDFLSILKNKHLLLDTNVFIEAFAAPSEFGKFFNKLKDSDVTVVTLRLVEVEFLRGAASRSKQNEKKKFMDDIVDTYLPMPLDFVDDVLLVMERLGNDSKASSVTDLVLGSSLAKYKNGLFLMTKDLSDFPTNVFERISYMNLLKPKAIHTFGIYSKFKTATE